MKYFVRLEVWPDASKGIIRQTETKQFEHTEAEPITPLAKAYQLFGKERVLEIYSEEEA